MFFSCFLNEDFAGEGIAVGCKEKVVWQVSQDHRQRHHGVPSNLMRVNNLGKLRLRRRHTLLVASLHIPASMIYKL